MNPLPFQPPFLIGVVHLPPTPGSPLHTGGAHTHEPSDADPVGEARAWLAHARTDARALVAGGVDGLIVENFGDTPFFAGSVPSETVASMALALEAVQAEAQGIPVGVNVLRNDARSALGLCAATGACFLRINVHTGAMVTDQGLIQGQAATTLRERARLGLAASILADVHVKHAVPLGNQSLQDAARDAVLRGHADGLVISGIATGAAVLPGDLKEVRSAVGPHVPLVLGSGCTLEQVESWRGLADGAIVGTALKQGGQVGAAVDEQRVRALVQAWKDQGGGPGA